MIFIRFSHYTSFKLFLTQSPKLPLFIISASLMLLLTFVIILVFPISFITLAFYLSFYLTQLFISLPFFYVLIKIIKYKAKSRFQQLLEVLRGLSHPSQSGNFKGCSIKFFEQHIMFHLTYERTSFTYPKSNNIYIRLLSTASNLKISRLIVGTVRARYQFPKSIVAWEPSLQIVFFSSCIIQSSRYDVYYLIGKS